MSEDVLDELLQTEKAANELLGRAEKSAVRQVQDTEEKIQQIQQELKQELKQKRQALKAELDAEYAREADKAQKKTEAKLEKLKVEKITMDVAAEFLAQKILA